MFFRTLIKVSFGGGYLDVGVVTLESVLRLAHHHRGNVEDRRMCHVANDGAEWCIQYKDDFSKTIFSLFRTTVIFTCIQSESELDQYLKRVGISELAPAAGQAGLTHFDL